MLERVKVGQKYSGRLVVSVRFNVSNTNSYQQDYNFFAMEDLELYSGDIVVCDTSRGYAVGRVVATPASPSQLAKACKWIVCKLDLVGHKERVAKEKEVYDIKKSMDQRLKEVEKSMKYRRLAQMDTVMAEMYTKLTELDGQSFPQIEEVK